MKRKHHELLVWQEAIKLVKTIYEITSVFPKHEIYALASQMRRAAVSVPSNIAEGAGRGSDREFMQYLNIARGSMSELETQIIIGHKLGYITDIKILNEKMEKLFGLLGGLIKHLKDKISVQT